MCFIGVSLGHAAAGSGQPYLVGRDAGRDTGLESPEHRQARKPALPGSGGGANKPREQDASRVWHNPRIAGSASAASAPPAGLSDRKRGPGPVPRQEQASFAKPATSPARRR
jgi:hypothetical protein